MSTPVSTPVWKLKQAISRIDAEIAELQAKRLRLLDRVTQRIEQNTAEAEAHLTEGQKASPFNYLHRHLAKKGQ